MNSLFKSFCATLSRGENMRHTDLKALSLLAVLLIAGAAVPLAAQPTAGSNYVDHFGSGATWPSESEWVAVSGFYDAHNSGVDEYMDFVGDATDPCLYIVSKGNYIYFRFRVHYSGNVTAASPFETNGIVGIIFNTDGDEYPEYGFVWDAKQNNNANHGLELMVGKAGESGTIWSDIDMDDADGSSGQKVWSPPDYFDFRNNGTDGYVRTYDEINTANFGYTTYVDIAVSCQFLSYINAQNATKYTMLCGQSLKMQLVSINGTNDHAPFNADIGNGADPSSAVGSWSSAQGTTLAELSSFTAFYADHRVSLAWQTAAEIDNAGFHVWRAEGEPTGFERITPALIPAQGGPTQAADYAYEDAGVRPGRLYFYKLEDLSLSGQAAFHGPIPSLASDIEPTFPSDGYNAQAGVPARFAWSSGDYEAFKLEFSASSDFAAPVVLPSGPDRYGWIRGEAYTPSAREWARIRTEAGASGIVYWRIHGETTVGAKSVSIPRWLKIL